MLKNCERCGRVFDSEGSEELCPECYLEDKKDLKKVKDYLNKNPLASVMEVCEKTGVPQAQILRFVRDGNLKLRTPLKKFKCSLCGKPVIKGTICDECKGKIEKGMDNKK
ncbi:MAG: MerR family transcriptional regulator [Candidatus Goldbacteria bacterium]|nr:MerR family transcriptional regulator [Candidatus Goldiibacteriota bacterium]